jgi:predicted nuclease of predicted toxin-antitoxin system
VRFLVDESIQQRVAVLLTEAGHDAIHLSDLGLLGATDDQVLAAAADSGRGLITADTDFGALLSLAGASRPSVLLLRRPGRHASQRTDAILEAVETARSHIEAGALVVVEPHRLRIRKLPITGLG